MFFTALVPAVGRDNDANTGRRTTDQARRKFAGCGSPAQEKPRPSQKGRGAFGFLRYEEGGGWLPVRVSRGLRED